MIDDDIHKSDCSMLQFFLGIYTDGNNLSCISRYDTKNKIRYMLDKFNYLMELKDKGDVYRVDSYLSEDIKKYIMDNYDISEALLLMIMLDVCLKLESDWEKATYVVFENLDTQYESEGLGELITEVGNFRNNAESVFWDMRYNGKRICAPSDEYYLIFVMRDTTKAEFSAQFNEHIAGQKISLYVPKESLTFNYRIDEILKRKHMYLESLKNENGVGYSVQCESNEKKFEYLKSVLQDKDIYNMLFKLFNNDIRNELSVLAEMVSSESNICKEFETYKKRTVKDLTDEHTWIQYGARCIVYRGVFDILNKEGFFATIRKLDYEESENGISNSVNLPRMILQYLHNASRNLIRNDYINGENDFIPLSELVTDLYKICSDTDKIANAIWKMYECRKQYNLNHLITFEQMNEITYQAICNETRNIIEKKTEEQCNLRITLAGIAYIENVLTHYEYFAARNQSIIEPSLFTWKINEFLNKDKLTSYLEKVLKDVRKCCDRLYRFEKSIYDRYGNREKAEELIGKFIFKRIRENESVSSMRHRERIIHSQISYIDAVRMYVLSQIDLYRAKQGCSEQYLPWLEMALSCMEGEKSPFSKEEFNILMNASIISIDVVNDNDYIKIECIKKSNGESVYLEYEYDKFIYSLKVALNLYFTDVIQKYINVFGIEDDEMKDSISDSTKILADGYKECILLIKKRGYSDFDTTIDRQNGMRLIKIRNMRLQSEE